MKITDYLKDNIVVLDGAIGTLLQKEGLVPGEYPERWNITHSDTIIKIHKEYLLAGSNVISANTFGANLLKFSKEELEEIITKAVENAKRAIDETASAENKWVALDIGPSGKMLAPFGELEFSDAVELFAETIKIGVKAGADLIFIETMNDSLETKAAVLAAKENSSLPIFVSNAYSEDGKLMTGTEPFSLIATLEGLGVSAIGVNCSFGPERLKPIVEKYLDASSLPVIFEPNAGMPELIDGKTVYNVSEEKFASDVCELVKKGVSIVGGCCGTTPSYIKAVCDKIKDIKKQKIKEKNITWISSYTHAVKFGEKPLLIGERINPTGKKRFRQALIDNEIDYILKEAISEQSKNVDILDVNVGIPDICEEEMLKNVVCEIQSVVNLPLQIDTSDANAMEKALRCYNGKALINSVSGKKESMEKIFPLAKKYGGVLVCLTLDEDGIPEKAEGRLKIAEKILNEAKKYGIEKKDLVFDPLCLTISSDKNAAHETLKAVRLIKEKLSCHTILGVSNVSFGLPKREMINSNFFSMALYCGLSAAIINPNSLDMLKSYHAYMAIAGMDDSFTKYISFAESIEETKAEVKKGTPQDEKNESSKGLIQAIVKGLKEEAAKITVEQLKTKDSLSIISDEIIPALDIVGVGFEKKTVYLPRLLMSAEAAKAAFEEIKKSSSKKDTGTKCPFVLATVKGDIHDIGKNIVKLLLENYGFCVTDLGKDVPPEKILDAVLKLKAPLCGLSALMTTTVFAMEETIRLIKEKAPFCKVVVGGAVLTPEYADKIGADHYGKDAMAAVRYAEKVYNEFKDK